MAMQLILLCVNIGKTEEVGWQLSVWSKGHLLQMEGVCWQAQREEGVREGFGVGALGGK